MNLAVRYLNYTRFFDLSQVFWPKIWYYFYMLYSEIIKDVMIENNLSQEKFAKMIGVNQTTVGQWLLGKKKPSYDNILQLYKVFGIFPNDLFDIN